MRTRISMLTLSATLIAASSAFAADLPSIKSAPAAAPVPMWTGFYAGLNAGYIADTGSGIQTSGVPGAGNFDTSEGSSGYETVLVSPGFASAASLFGLASMNSGGFIGGGQIGYNYQLLEKFVVGLEADIQGTTQQSNGSHTSGAIANYDAGTEQTPFITSVSGSKSLPWLGTVRARAGYLVLPNLLVYGTGGFAYGGVNTSATITQGAYNSLLISEYVGTGYAKSNYSTTLTGWTAGGGFEWMFMPNWTLKAEGLYYSLGNANWSTFVLNTGGYGYTPTFTPGYYTAAGAQHSANFGGAIGRVGVNYHFNFANVAPVVAKF